MCSTSTHCVCTCVCVCACVYVSVAYLPVPYVLAHPSNPTDTCCTCMTSDSSQTGLTNTAPQVPWLFRLETSGYMGDHEENYPCIFVRSRALPPFTIINGGRGRGGGGGGGGRGLPAYRHTDVFVTDVFQYPDSCALTSVESFYHCCIWTIIHSCMYKDLGTKPGGMCCKQSYKLRSDLPIPPPPPPPPPRL